MDLVLCRLLLLPLRHNGNEVIFFFMADDENKMSIMEKKDSTKQGRRRGKSNDKTERRAEFYMDGTSKDVDEQLINQYSWMIPNQKAFNVLRHFS